MQVITVGQVVGALSEWMGIPESKFRGVTCVENFLHPSSVSLLRS